MGFRISHGAVGMGDFLDGKTLGFGPFYGAGYGNNDFAFYGASDLVRILLAKGNGPVSFGFPFGNPSLFFLGPNHLGLVRLVSLVGTGSGNRQLLAWNPLGLSDTYLCNISFCIYSKLFLARE